MNIELIKTELEKLSLMLSSWESVESVSAIERDIVLDKLKKIYDFVRFTPDNEAATLLATPAPAATSTEDSIEAEPEEQDVEVELIFAEDDDFFSSITKNLDEDETAYDSEEQENIPQVEQEVEPQEPLSLTSEILASAMALASTKEEQETIEEQEQIEETTTAIDPEPINASAPATEISPIIEIETNIGMEVETETEMEVELQPEPLTEDIPAESTTSKEATLEEPQLKSEEPKSLNSLFGLEDVQRRPRTKHQRMMSIYNNSESRQEKVVDISKIFDVDIDAPKPISSMIAEQTIQSSTTPAPAQEERTVTIADAMAATTHTLADTIVTSAALGEDMSHSKIQSLREGIGLNDKFLMIRDLFDGDDEAYSEAITALDELETLDDCMIHIIENYTWNPDTEGSKFIMQLLERKLS